MERGSGEALTAGEVIRASVSSSVLLLLTHVPAVRLGDDPRAVHQARVATRRLRSGLRTFAPLVDRVWARELRRELRWLAAALGVVRDGDVLDARLAAAIADCPDVDAEAGAEILTYLAGQRARDRAVLDATLGDERALDLYERLIDAATDPALGKRARRLAATALPPLVRGPWEALRDRVDELGPAPTTAELHEVRILAKRARYAADTVAPAIGKPARSFAKGARRIQNRLGDQQDYAVATEWLEREAGQLSGSAAFAAGQIAQHLRAHATATDEDWRPAFEKMRCSSAWLET